MPTPQKELKVSQIKEKLSAAHGFIITDYRGITVKDISVLRRKFRNEKVEYRIFKNNLASIAISGFPYASVSEHMKNTTAIAIAYGDPLAPLKILKEFEKTRKITVKGGVIEGQVFDVTTLMAMRDLPSMNELRSMLLNTLQAPARGLVTVLGAGAKGLVQVLSQRAKKLEEAA